MFSDIQIDIPKYVEVKIGDLTFIVVMDEEDDPAVFGQALAARSGHGITVTEVFKPYTENSDGTETSGG